MNPACPLPRKPIVWHFWRENARVDLLVTDKIDQDIAKMRQEGLGPISAGLVRNRI